MNENNSFKEIIDTIEPAEGAKERMLQNIKRKAETQTVQNTSSKPSSLVKIMKWALPAAACLAIVVVGINLLPRLRSTPIGNESGVQIPNPFVGVNTLDEIEEQLGISVKLPDGAENAAYFIIDGSIASIDFEYGGKSYTLRASKQSGDFSGINGTLINSDKIDAANDAVLETIRGFEYNYFKLMWTDGAVTYILANNAEISTDDITGVYQKIK
ncbi:MAG: hypothetical protein ACI4JS_09840 [Oscillospiraceae bacterium]